MLYFMHLIGGSTIAPNTNTSSNGGASSGKYYQNIIQIKCYPEVSSKHSTGRT